jgi:hypothetical protein
MRRTDRCCPGFVGLCAGRSGTEAGGADFAPASHRIFVSNGSFPPDYKYPFTYLGEDKVAIQIISLPSLSLSSIKEHSKLEDLPFYPLKSKSLWYTD